MSENSPTTSADSTLAGSPKPRTVAQLMKPTTTIEVGAHLAAAAYLIKHSHDEGLVVLDTGTDEPVATIMRAALAKAVADGRDPEETHVSDVVPEDSVAVDTDVRVEDAARLMLSLGVDSLPVMRGRQIVGIVELDDVRGMSPAQ